MKLRALVRDHLGRDPEGSPVPAGPLTGLVHGDEAWVLLADGAGLGAAVLWARRQTAGRLHVLAEADTGVLARRAALLAVETSVWFVEGRTLLPAQPVPRSERPLAPDHERFVDPIAQGGAEPLVEHGVLSGEVAGLEVCVVVDDPTRGAAVLEVGVGPHDCEAFAMMYPGLSDAEAVRRVVDAVAPHRQPGAEPHPFNRLAAQRLLRHWALAEPGLVGAVGLRAVEPPVARTGVKDPSPCVAVGELADGRTCVVVFSTGVDPDLVPFAADARDHVAPEAVVVLAVPARDSTQVEALSRGLLPVDPLVVGLST
jgi:hypothetical protein